MHQPVHDPALAAHPGLGTFQRLRAADRQLFSPSASSGSSSSMARVLPPLRKQEPLPPLIDTATSRWHHAAHVLHTRATSQRHAHRPKICVGIVPSSSVRCRFFMHDNKWTRLWAYITGLVNQRLLMQCEYSWLRVEPSGRTWLGLSVGPGEGHARRDRETSGP
jgi:hypothetical protein